MKLVVNPIIDVTDSMMPGHQWLGSCQSKSALKAVGDMTVAPSDRTEDLPSNPIQSNNRTVYEQDAEDDEEIEDLKAETEYMDGSKMVRVCDKLIEVFMVDKPTATDWRRLLAFSKEWSNIRPHFYKRCQERADAESDPGMKHKLLRLGRKLKEVHLTSSCYSLLSLMSTFVSSPPITQI